MKLERRLVIRCLVALAIVAAVLGFLVVKRIAEPPAYVYFKNNVAPILATTCSSRDEKGGFGCHATNDLKTQASKKSTATFHHLAPNLMTGSCDTACHRMTGKNAFTFSVDKNGKITDEKQVVYAYQQAKKLAGYSKTAFAKILRYPLGSLAGGFGLNHAGGEIFDSANDPRYLTLLEWVKMESVANNMSKGATISTAEAFFGKEVLPIFAKKGCLNANCHAFNHSTFVPDPGLNEINPSADLSQRFSPEQVSYNRMTAKGLIQSDIYLSGDTRLSRILRKTIPIENGGMIHRGGNERFFTGVEDPDYQKIKQWVDLEKEETLAKTMIGGKPVEAERMGRVEGVVFVKAPSSNHRKFLDVGKFLPGGDLYLVKVQKGEKLENAKAVPVNLTKDFHRGRPADIRKPFVRYDGRAILFSMRVGEDDNLNIYEIRLDDNLDLIPGSFRKLTFGPKYVNGIKVHYIDPVYGPDPDDASARAGGANLDRADILFASNMAGFVTKSIQRGIVCEAHGGTTREIYDISRSEKSGSFVGRHLYVVDGANKGEWRTIVKYENELFSDKPRSTFTVDKPFSQAIDNSSIFVIEKDDASQAEYMPSYSVYGIKAAQQGAEKTTYDATVSRISYGVGQELELSLRTTGEIFFTSLRGYLDKYDRPIFNMGSTRRHLNTRFSFPTHQGNRSEVLIYASNIEMPSGTDIHIGMDPNSLWMGGNLTISDHQLGPGIEANNPNDYVTGFFDENGYPVNASNEQNNAAYKLNKWVKQPSHTRFLFTHTSLFPVRGPKAVTRTGVSPNGAFRDAYPLPDGDILVSYSPKRIDHLDPNANPDYALYLIREASSFQTEGGRGAPDLQTIKINIPMEAGMSAIQAYPVYARFKPKSDAAGEPNIEQLIRHPGMADDDFRPAMYLERNYLAIDAIMHDPSPVGKQVALKLDSNDVDASDEVKYVRMVEVLPLTTDMANVDTTKIKNHDPVSTRISNGVSPKKRIVGEAPIEDDGSIFIKVPSKVPMIIQSLNKDKMALRQEARQYFFAPNERFTISPAPSQTFQTCGACMGAMSGKSDTLFGPVNVFTGNAKVTAISKAKGNPPAYGLSVAERSTVDFEKDIQPILNEKCVSCHSGAHAAKGLDLSGDKTAYYNLAYENLQQLREPESRWFSKKKYLSERNALAIESYFIAKIYGRQLKAERALEGDVPHPSAEFLAQNNTTSAPLTDDEKLTFVRWVDMGAAYLAPSAAEGLQPKTPVATKADTSQAKDDWRTQLRPIQ